MGVVRREGIKKVLSHRRTPFKFTATTMGALPQGMMQARYPEPTWINLLNH